jgi:hypothetical protein
MSIEGIRAQLAALDVELAAPDAGAEERGLRAELEAKQELRATRAIAEANDALLRREGWERPTGFMIGNGARTCAIWHRQFLERELRAIAEASMKGPPELERVKRRTVLDCIMWMYPHDAPPPKDDAASAHGRWVEAWIESRLIAYPTLWDELYASINAHTAARRDTLRGKV